MRFRSIPTFAWAGIAVGILTLGFAFRHGAMRLQSAHEEARTAQEPPGREAELGADHPASRTKKLDRIEKLIEEKFPEQGDAAFNTGPGCMAESYRLRGLTDFCGQMRSALRGDKKATAEIFTTYATESESYKGIICLLIENLGDEFFHDQIKQQPHEVQVRVLGQIWQVIDRSKLDYHHDGSIPVADSGRLYPKTGRLYLSVWETELQSPYWQRRKNLRTQNPK